MRPCAGCGVVVGVCVVGGEVRPCAGCGVVVGVCVVGG